ncbi:MAG: DedA family protein [Thermoanaerobaculia bacterium]
MTHSIVVTAARHPYTVLILGIAAENAGLPLPGEVLLILVAATAAATRVSLPLVAMAAALGALLGDNFSYWLGRKGGVRLIDRYCQVTLCSWECGARMSSFYRRYGLLAVAVARFVPTVRALAAPVVGMTRMAWVRFLLVDALGALLWATAFTLAGRAVGTPLLKFLEGFRAYGTWAVAALLTAAVTTLIYRVLKRKKYGKATAVELREAAREQVPE